MSLYFCETYSTLSGGCGDIGRWRVMKMPPAISAGGIFLCVYAGAALVDVPDGAGRAQLWNRPSGSSSRSAM